MTRWCSVGLLFLSQLAYATEIKVTAKDGQTAVVLVDEYVKGEAPVTTEADPGEVTLAFRKSMFGPVLFSEKVEVPDSGALEVLVDMDERTVTVNKVKGSATPAPAPAPAPSAGSGDAPAPEAGKGVITVKAAEDGMPIELDGKDTGKKTPAHLQVAPGKHVIKLAKGCYTGEEELSVAEGASTEVSVKLDADKAMLAVRSDPAGATLYVDGTEMGKTPLDVKVSCGERQLKATMDGYLAKEQSVDVGSTDAIELKLDKDAWGSLEVSVEPADSDILLDGKKIGRGKAELEKVMAGAHTLTIERKGKEVQKKDIDVKDGGSVVLALVVSDAAGDTKGPKPPKTKGDGPKVAPIVIGAAGIIGSAPLIGLGVYNYGQARIAYDDYLNTDDPDTAQQIFDEEVAPRQTVAFIEWGAGGVCLVGGAALVAAGFLDGEGIWAHPTPNGFVIGGRF